MHARRPCREAWCVQIYSSNSSAAAAEVAAEFPSEWLRETIAVAARCTFSLEELRDKYPAGDRTCPGYEAW